MIEALRSGGNVDAIRIQANLRSYRTAHELAGPDREYLFPANPPSVYPLTKVLIAVEVLRSAIPASERRILRARLQLLTRKDHWYTRRFKAIPI